MANSIKKVNTPKAPKAIGPYSQAISIASSERLIFVSGQLPIDPETGELVQGDISRLTERVFDNIEEILNASGSSLEHVVRMDVFLTNLDDFAAMNAVYANRVRSAPARQTIQVSKLPKGASIEISCIAIAK